MRIQRTRAFVASISTVALAGLRAATLAPMAQAADLGSGSMASAFITQETPNPALIDADRDTTLNVMKYLGGDSGSNGDGSDLGEAAPDLPVVGGVEFTAFQVHYVDDQAEGNVGAPIDLLTNRGWAVASDLAQQTLKPVQIETGQFEYNGTTYMLVERATTVTDGGGVATFEDLGIGFFLVQETNNEDAFVGEESVTGAITPVAPFFVTLPMTDPNARQSWMYDVHVYPKNQSDTISKVVEDKGVVGGQEDQNAATYTLTATIPDGTVDLGYYAIGDYLDEKVTFVEAAIELNADHEGAATVPMLAGEDYILHLDPEGEGTPGQLVVFSMTQAGLTKLQAHRDLNVVVTMDVTFEAGHEVIPNEAWFIPSDGWWDHNLRVPAPAPGEPVDPRDPENPFDPPSSEEVYTLLGSIQVQKRDADTQVPLADAVFAIHWAGVAGGEDGEEASAMSCTLDDLGDMIIGGLTTNVDGQFSFDGLQASYFYDNSSQDIGQGYCLVETESPDGYQLLAQAIPFTIDYEVGSQDGTFTVPPVQIEVLNAQDNLGSDLPLTGGVGAAGLGLGTLALIGGAVVYAVRRGNRENTNAAVSATN